MSGSLIAFGNLRVSRIATEHVMVRMKNGAWMKSPETSEARREKNAIVGPARNGAAARERQPAEVLIACALPAVPSGDALLIMMNIDVKAIISVADLTIVYPASPKPSAVIDTLANLFSSGVSTKLPYIQKPMRLEANTPIIRVIFGYTIGSSTMSIPVVICTIPI